MPRTKTALLLAPLLAACASRPNAPAAASTPAPLDRPIAVVDSFTAPEAVRYDPAQDVYFVSNFGEGNPAATDNNGFISRMRPDGSIERLRWIAGGTNSVTLHAPRGMTIVGDTLWVADADAVRGFNRVTGAPVRSVSFSGIDVGFLNDVAPAPDGTIYITDTGKNRIYRVNNDASIAIGDQGLGAPNGITWDATNSRFIVVPYSGAHAIRAWNTATNALIDVGTSANGARFDGVEVLPGNRVLVASQADSSLQLFEAGTGRPIIRSSGPPADIAVDTRRNRVAIPIIRLNRVEIWQLPGR